MKRFLLMAPLSLALTGCATVTVNYAPSSTMTLSGSEQLGAFKYAPGDTGKVKENQIRNTAIGNIMIDRNVGEYFKQALFDESRFVGIKMGQGPVVHGTINDFLIDDLGYSVDWTLDVTYVVDSVGGGAPCYNQQKVLKKHTAKFANAFGTLNEVVKDNIEEAFKDPAFVSCIQTTHVAAATAPPAPAPVAATTTTATPPPPQPESEAKPTAVASSPAPAADPAPVQQATPVATASTPTVDADLALAQTAANQVGCGAVKANGNSTYTAACGDYSVLISCDGGQCRPEHTIKGNSND
ncbi:hypothetical protein DWU98_02775 [Dyella monticola]|uniref:Lipoprotein n=1 Tax=Dyella monticola TaxID=1927958 RepID=A0A370X957_9GAMM|nr:hypothetical protein [Dyella monticola]RDS84896.1 hypothetical protein DWU98_02775 [Dyella monticola]